MTAVHAGIMHVVQIHPVFTAICLKVANYEDNFFLLVLSSVVIASVIRVTVMVTVTHKCSFIHDLELRVAFTEGLS